jgi:hypothetical protein
MEYLDKLKNELPPDFAADLSEFVVKYGNSMVERLSELDRRLTNTNFVTNGGGAVAVLALMGQKPVSLPVQIALLLFAAGVIATGVEVRALLIHFGAIASDNHNRNQLFNRNQISARELGTISPKVGRISKWANHVAGWLSQLLFATGVMTAAFGFLYARI